MSDVINELMAKYAAKVQEVKDFKAAAAKTVENEMKEIFTSFFEDHPEVTIIWWTQYTPYFNDGDTCVFNMNEVVISSDKPARIKKANYPDDLSNLVYLNNDSDYRKFSKLLYSLEEIWHEIYGDHVSIKVTPKGITVEEVDHD